MWLLFFLLLALFLRHEKQKKRSLVTAIVLLMLFSNTVLLRSAKNAYIKQISFSEMRSRYTAGIVLGGMASYNPVTERVVFNRAADRLFQTLALYKKGTIDKIIISGGSGYLLSQEHKEAVHLKQFLQAVGIPPEDVICENKSRNTFENAQFTSQLISERGLEGPFLLITSAIHMPRARKCFLKHGLELDIYAANYNYGSPYRFNDYLLPNAQNLKEWEHLIHELIGILAYKIFGYL